MPLAYANSDIVLCKIFNFLTITRLRVCNLSIALKPQQLNLKLINNVDINNTIDYMRVDINTSNIVTVQERFRDNNYYSYNDFTIRYE